MATRIHSKLVKNLTDEEYKQCYSLNMREAGEMRYSLSGLRKGGGDARVYMLKEDGKKILSWALQFNDSSAYFYTRAAYRRKHLASRIMKKMLRDNKAIRVYPHDEISKEFFSRFGEKNGRIKA